MGPRFPTGEEALVKGGHWRQGVSLLDDATYKGGVKSYCRADTCMRGRGDVD